MSLDLIFFLRVVSISKLNVLLVLGLFFVLIVSGLILYQTSFGKTVYGYVIDSKIELKKVSWPTKQETTQTALGVIVIVVIIGILLWLLDMLLSWAIGTLYGVR